MLQVVEMFYERQVINCLKYLRQIKLVLPMQTIDINYSNNDKNYCNFVKKKKIKNNVSHKGAEKTRMDVVINSMDLPVSTQNACYHALEIRDYLPGSPGKLYV